MNVFTSLLQSVPSKVKLHVLVTRSDLDKMKASMIKELAKSQYSSFKKPTSMLYDEYDV